MVPLYSTRTSVSGFTPRPVRVRVRDRVGYRVTVNGTSPVKRDSIEIARSRYPD